MGGAVCKSKPDASNSRARPLACRKDIEKTEDASTREIPPLLSDAPSHRPAASSLSALKSLGDAIAAFNVRSHADSPTGIRRPISSPSSSIPRPQPMRSLSDDVPMVMREATAARGPNATSLMPVMGGSVSSTCSAFSLYSISSPLQELPRRSSLPLCPETSLRALSSMKAASAVQGATPTTAAAPLALPDAPTLATKFLVPRNRRGSDDSSTHRREDKTLENNVVQAARGTFLSSPSIKTAATPLHTVSSALLDISFDSRVFAVNNATTSTEINRLGNRLRDLQHEQYDLSVARAYSVHVSSASSDIDSVSRAHHYVLENSRGISETLPDASTASLELSTGSAKPSLSDQGLRGEQLHAETVKFVSLIQEIQRMRTSGRPDYAWFRRETVLPTTNSGSSGDGGGGGESDGHGEVGAASSVVSPTLLPSISERAPPSGEGRGESVSGLNVSSDLYRQSLLRQRNRSSRSVHWLPFEMHESDPQANSSRTPMCFCGFQAENLLADSVSAACSHGCYPVTEADLDKSNSQHLLELGVLYATVIADAASHPLPLGAPPIDRSSLHRVDAETDKNNFLSDSNRPLSITADTTPCTSAPSFSNGSLSFCPVHIFYSPVSILAPRRRTKPPSPIRPSEARLPLSETLQVNVPATNRTALSPAKRPSAHPTAFATQGSTDDKPRSETGDRRPIIHVGVPHRKQLAKRALEDNRLFFSMPFQTRKKLLYSEN